ncbi:MAG: hypothetical protein RLZ11_56 [Bacteroidota bacterium]
MLAHGFGDQQAADEDEERQRQHLQRRVLFDHGGDAAAESQHDDQGDHHRGNHHGNVVRHADGGENAVEAEDNVEESDLDDGSGEAASGLLLLLSMRIRPLHDTENLVRTLPQEEEAAAQKDQIPPAHRVLPDAEQRLLEAHDPRNSEQHGNPEHERQSDAQAARLPPSLLRKLVRQNADKDDVIDAEHNLQKG